MVLLVTSFLFLRNLAQTHAANPGFDTSHTLVAQVSFVEQRYTAEGRARRCCRTAAERIEALPGFERASFSLGMPLTIRHGRTSGAPGLASRATARQARVRRAIGRRTWWARATSRRSAFRCARAATSRRAMRRLAARGRRQRGVRRGATSRARRAAGPAPHAARARPTPEPCGDRRRRRQRQVPHAGRGARWRRSTSRIAQRPGGGRFVHVVARAAARSDAAIAAMTRAIGDLDRPRPSTCGRCGDAGVCVPAEPVGAALLGSLGAIGLTLADGRAVRACSPTR